MYRIKELLHTNYKIDGNFGFVRRGDLIAILAVIESLRFQYSKKIRFNIVNMNEFLRDVARSFFDGYIHEKEGTEKCPIEGNVWVYYDYLHKFLDVRLRMPNKYKELKNPDIIKIVINPLFDAPYNRDRNWNPELFKKILNMLLSLPEHYQIVVTGSSTQIKNLPDLSNCRAVLNDIHASMEEISTADVYIGGDTGLTHFASSVDKHPLLVVTLYGHLSDIRHEKGLRHDVTKILAKNVEIPHTSNQEQYIHASFAPRVPKSKFLVYALLNPSSSMDDDSLNQMMSYIVNVRKIKTALKLPPTDHFKQADTIAELTKGRSNLNILEIGRLKAQDKFLTPYLAFLANTLESRLYSVGSDYQDKMNLQLMLHGYGTYTDDVYLMINSTNRFLSNWNKNIKRPIDLISFEPEGNQKLLNLLKQAEPHLHNGSLLLVNSLDESVISYMKSRGYESIDNNLYRKVEVG